MCVCVCVRERERERTQVSWGKIGVPKGVKRERKEQLKEQREGVNTQSNEGGNNNKNNNKDSTNLAFFSPRACVSWSRAEGINLLKNKSHVRRQAVIKVLTDQSASDSEPAIILTESNEHSKPCSAPNMKGDVICWQLASRRGSRRGERNGGRGEERGREREKSVTGREKGRWRERGVTGAEGFGSAPSAAPLPPHLLALTGSLS